MPFQIYSQRRVYTSDYLEKPVKAGPGTMEQEGPDYTQDENH